VKDNQYIKKGSAAQTHQVSWRGRHVMWHWARKHFSSVTLLSQYDRFHFEVP